MSYCFASDNAGYCGFNSPAINSHYFRWHKSCRDGVYDVTTKKAALDEGRPAELVRTFSAVADDFGQLVEVPA